MKGGMMAYISALFDGDIDLENAMTALEHAGLDDDVVRVIDSSDRAAGGGRVIPVAGLLQEQAAVAPAAFAASWGSEFDLDDEEAGYLNDALQDGASLLVLESGKTLDAEQILRKTNAQRVLVKA
jgi:hypothetical protein